MTFTRSNSGLRNLHLFHNVEAVVFTEGGAPISHADVCSGQCDREALDILYWRRLFEQLAPGKRLEFRAVGSKGNLLKIAEEVENGLPNVYVTMDSDVDRLAGSIKSAPGILYTWGYSWENDLFQPVALREIVFRLCPLDRATAEASIQAEIDEALSDFIAACRWYVAADVLLLIHEGSGLFDRSDPSCRRYVRAASSTTDPPRFQPHDLANRLRDKNAAKQAPIPSGTIATAKPERDCYGHLVGRFLSHLVLFLLKKYGAFASLSLDGAYAVLIDAVTVSIGRPEAAELRKHHEAQLAFLSA